MFLNQNPEVKRSIWELVHVQDNCVLPNIAEKYNFLDLSAFEKALTKDYSEGLSEV